MICLKCCIYYNKAASMSRVRRRRHATVWERALEAWARWRAGRTLVERPPGITPGQRAAIALGAGLAVLVGLVGGIVALI